MNVGVAVLKEAAPGQDSKRKTPTMNTPSRKEEKKEKNEKEIT